MAWITRKGGIFGSYFSAANPKHSFKIHEGEEKHSAGNYTGYIWGPKEDFGFIYEQISRAAALLSGAEMHAGQATSPEIILRSFGGHQLSPSTRKGIGMPNKGFEQLAAVHYMIQLNKRSNKAFQ